MTKQRRERGIFDPDYRTKGWNQSRYAPKNRKAGNITQEALLLTVLLCIPAFLIIRQQLIPNAYTWVLQDARHRTVDEYIFTQLLSPTYLTWGIIGFVVTWMTIAMLLRRAEWRRINRVTPVDVVEERYAIDRRAMFSLADLTPREFEEEVARIIERRAGFRAVVCGGAGDCGVDIRIYKGNRLAGIVQCKKYDPSKSLPPMFVREIATARAQQGVDVAYLVTTARFSEETRYLARTLGVRLIDGAELERLRARVYSRRVDALPTSQPPENVWRRPPSSPLPERSGVRDNAPRYVERPTTFDDSTPEYRPTPRYVEYPTTFKDERSRRIRPKWDVGR